MPIKKFCMERSHQVRWLKNMPISHSLTPVYSFVAKMLLSRLNLPDTSYRLSFLVSNEGNHPWNG